MPSRRDIRIGPDAFTATMRGARSQTALPEQSTDRVALAHVGISRGLGDHTGVQGDEGTYCRGVRQYMAVSVAPPPAVFKHASALPDDA